MKKSDLDRAVAIELDEPTAYVSLVTEMFLTKLLQAIASGEEVKLKGFGKFRLANQGGGPIPRFGTAKETQPAHLRRRFRVHFSKSENFRKEVQKNQEKVHGKSKKGSSMVR